MSETDHIVNNLLNSSLNRIRSKKMTEKTEISFGKRVRILRKMLQSYSQMIQSEIGKSEIKLNEIFVALGYMSEQLIGEHGSQLKEIFIGYLKVLSTLANDPPDTFAITFEKVTVLLCEICPKLASQTSFAGKILNEWRNILQNLTQQQRYTIFLSVDSLEFTKCVELVTIATSSSLQIMMLDILCAYIESDRQTMVNWLASFFKDIGFSTIDVHECFSAMDFDHFLAKQLLLYNLNKRIKNNSIYTEIINSAKFGNKTINFENEGFFSLNKSSNTVEFWFSHKKKTIKTSIKSSNVKKVQIKDNGLPYVDEIIFQLNSPPCLETDGETKNKSTTFQSEEIAVTFICGFSKMVLQPLIAEMFKMEAELLPKPTYDFDGEAHHDSDIEIIEPEPEEKPTSEVTASKPAKHKMEKIDLVINDDEPVIGSFIKRPRLSKEPLTVQLPTESSAMDKLGVKLGSRIHLGTIDVSENEPFVDTKNVSSTSSGIAVSTFYAKPKKNPMKRITSTQAKPSTRASTRSLAKKAIDELVQKSGYVANDEPQTKKKLTSKHKKDDAPVEPLPTFKAFKSNQPNKFMASEVVTVADGLNERKPNTSTWSDAILTPINFKKSTIGNKRKENNQIIANLIQINENIQQINTNPSVSYSYRAAGKRDTKPKEGRADTATESQKSVINVETLDIGNVDANANIKPCQCTAIAKKMAKLSCNIANALDTSSCKCQCQVNGTLQMNESQ